MFAINLYLKKSSKKVRAFKTRISSYKMSIYLSNKHIYCQLINTIKNRTIKCCSSLSEKPGSALKYNSNLLSSYIFGLRMRLGCDEKISEQINMSLSRRNTLSNGKYRSFAAGFTFL
jgi:ribosomal protein L18